MMRRGVRSGVRGEGDARTGRTGTRRPARGRWCAVVALALLATFAGCAAQGSAQPAPTKPPTVTVTLPTATATVATTPTPTPVTITDLNAFRQQLASAMQSGQWAKMQSLLSPSFSFQEPTAGSHLLMPDAAQHLQQALKDGNPWNQGADYFVANHSCYAGSTPLTQVIGFVGNNNSYLLFGIEHPTGQSYWQVNWGFEDPQGPYDGCIGDE